MFEEKLKLQDNGEQWRDYSGIYKTTEDKELKISYFFNTKHNHRIQTAANSRSKSITLLQSWETLEFH
jgi:hypothetical protein